MSLVALCSASGAPGVTTAALAVAWAWPHTTGRRCLLVDADPAGSGLLPGFLEAGIPAGGGVLGLATERSLSPDTVLRHTVSLDPDEYFLVLTGVIEPAQARPLASTWTHLIEVARTFDDSGLDVVVDAGRLGHRCEPTALLEAADVAVVVTRSNLAGLAPARAGLAALRESRAPGAPTLVLAVGRPAPYSPAEIAAALDVEALTLPQDPRAARALALGGRADWRLARSPLLRAAGETAASLAARRRAPVPRVEAT